MTKTSDAHLLADSELAGLHPQAPAPDEAQRLRQVLPPTARSWQSNLIQS